MNLKAVATVAAVGAATCALAACGASGGSHPGTTVSASQKPHATTTEKGRLTPKLSNPEMGTAVAQSAPHRARGHRTQQDRVPSSVRPPGEVQRMRGTAEKTRRHTVSTAAGGVNPCALVSMSEVEAITGGAVAGRVEAPLGPTCVYKLESKSEITMTVETINVSQVTHQLKRAHSLTVGGRRAYCGMVGAEMLFVPLGHDQVLNVTAPCEVAQRLAARALNRLPAA